MKSTTIFCILLSLSLFLHNSKCLAQKQDSKTGIFLDTLKVSGMELRVAVTISETTGQYSALLTSIDQGSGQIPFDEVTISDNHFLAISQKGIQVEGDFNDERTKITGEFRQGPGKFPMVFQRVEMLPVNKRTQEPQKPFPYNEEEVVYKNEKAGIQLAGTLTLPKGEGPFTAVILLTGSGPQNRNEEVFGHKPFLVISDYLTRNGIAVLRVDDRGVGGSTGDQKNSTSGDFAEDALAGINYLKTRKEINPQMIGLIGHSEGGMIAPLVASKTDEVAFVIMLAGPGSNLGDNVNYQRSLMAQKTGASEEYIRAQERCLKAINEIARKDISEEKARAEIKQMYADLNENDRIILNWSDERLNGSADMILSKWWRFGLKYEPETTIQSLHCPVLALLGEKDQQVPAAMNQKELERATRNQNGKSKVVVMPGLNHLFQTCGTGEELEYSRIEETISQVVLDLIKNWVVSL